MTYWTQQVETLAEPSGEGLYAYILKKPRQENSMFKTNLH